jgi:predicted porin
MPRHFFVVAVNTPVRFFVTVLPYPTHKLCDGFQKNVFNTLIATTMTYQARKNLLSGAAALAAMTVMFPGAASAQALDFTWYGRIDTALESNSNGAVNRTSIQNFSSRLGIKGERKFNADLSGIFQVETGIAPDDTTQSKTLASRNSFVGLKSVAAGTVIVGTNDMPLKSLEGTAYALWAEGDLQELIIHGKASRTAIGSTVFNNVHTRQTNVLLYTSPKFFNTVAKVAYSPDEGKIAATATVPEIAKPVFGTSIAYDDGTFNAGLATQSQKNFIAPTATTAGFAMKGTKFVFGAKMDAWTAGMAFSKLNNNNGRATSNVIATGTYALNSDITLKASLGKSGESAANAADGVRATALEADYALDKQVTLYSYFTKLSNAKNAKGSFAAADNFPAVVNAGDSPRALGLGIRYNF